LFLFIYISLLIGSNNNTYKNGEKEEISLKFEELKDILLFKRDGKMVKNKLIFIFFIILTKIIDFKRVFSTYYPQGIILYFWRVYS